MAAMTELERDLTERRIHLHTAKIAKFLLERENLLKDRLLLYLMTPKSCFTTFGTIPEFVQFATEYGSIRWSEDFPFLLRDQAVNLVKMCRHAVIGNYTYFPSYWTQDMIFMFVKDCVDQGIHEFDYYW